MTINGIPLHPLIVHAAVVLTPLAALAILIFALKPAWRWATRTPTVVLAVASALSLQLAAMTGDSLKETIGKNSAILQRHEQFAGYTQATMWVLAAVVVLAWWSFPHATKLAGADDREAKLVAARMPLTVLMVIGAVLVAVFVVITGDAGAQSVWTR